MVMRRTVARSSRRERVIVVIAAMLGSGMPLAAASTAVTTTSAAIASLTDTVGVSVSVRIPTVSHVALAEHGRMPEADRTLRPWDILNGPSDRDDQAMLAMGEWQSFFRDYDEIRFHRAGS